MQIADNKLDEFELIYQDPSELKQIHRKMEFNRFRQGIKIVLHHSFVLPKLLHNYFLSFLGKYPLRSLEVAVGYDCNFSCQQCSCALNRNAHRKRLSLDKFKNAIDQAISMGAFQFNLNGGEPLLYFEEVKELCGYIRKKGCYVHMATNGFFFNSDRMKAMKDVGLCSFEMGLDSSVELIHDANRSKGSFKKIMDNTEIAQKLKISVAYNTVGTKEKIYSGDLINTIYLAKKNGVMLMITPPCVTGFWSGKTEVLLNEKEQWYIRWLLSIHPEVRIDNYNGLKGLSCPAAREKMAINPYGDVVSCPLIQIVYGNVISDKLLDLQKKMLKDHYYLKKHRDSCLPSSDLDFIRERLINYRDTNNARKELI